MQSDADVIVIYGLFIIIIYVIIYVPLYNLQHQRA